jgi:pimeloyl-ACP methyl ester carboxylesterase
MPVAENLYYFLHQTAGISAPAVVLLHGAGGNHLYWPAEVRRMPASRLFSLDLPGHGKSDRCGGLQSIPAYMDAVLDWMQAVDLQSAILVGHSMGGAIAMNLALEHPERVSGLVLVATGARLRINPETLENAANPTTVYRAIETMVSQFFSPAAPPALVQQAARGFAEVRPSVLYGDLQACHGFDILDRVAQIQAPALVIAGQDDQLIPLRYAQFLAASLPASRLQVVPQAGHMVMLENPQAVVNSIQEFLASFREYAI